MFSDIELINHLGSWVKVQVAFYDFIFMKATELHAACWKDMALNEVMDGFRDGEDFYERSVAAIESHFESFESAFAAFKEHVAAEKLGSLQTSIQQTLPTSPGVPGLAQGHIGNVG